MRFVFGRNVEFQSPHVLTIGNFDGVHVGHQRVIEQARLVATRLELPLTVLLFEPQPREFFARQKGQSAPARLMSLNTKVATLKSLGVDSIWCLKFSDIRHFTARTFVDQLVSGKRVARVVVGDDFRFGCDRQGDFDFLVDAGTQCGFTAEQSETHLLGGLRVSSSHIRELLKVNDFDGAARMLGRSYVLCGRVSYGQQLGRQIGFPTANIALPNSSPIHGVFGCSVEIPSGRVSSGVANIGSRPTVSGQKVRLEVHLHEFFGELYGLRLTVTPRIFIRAEQKFENLEVLTEQIRIDNDKARESLNFLNGSEIE
ncbi:MAG: bifunctional riboflavin kinase/FMN adenylyltransferase [Gammaproteobacteria bacterium]|nr:bifunctional riboflavin kinase/FMN adenylyltransferase [Gammaproteobacteria bacterium]